jgi:metallophosphoesterase (TIGR00282 family)
MTFHALYNEPDSRTKTIRGPKYLVNIDPADYSYHMSPLKIIMIGDVVGDPGLNALEACLPRLIKENSADLTVVNGENSAGGFGITRETLHRILAAGADVVTSGNHVWEKRDFWPLLDEETKILRPANYPAGSSGRGWVKIVKAASNGGPCSFVVINLQGRELMTPIDCPFKTFDAIFDSLQKVHTQEPARAGEPGDGDAFVLVDFHAETSREKESLAFYLDGRAALIAGTHTHVQTADERVLPGGTAYITDLGMTGAASAVLGMDSKICLDRARTQVLYRMEVAASTAGVSVQGIIAEIDRNTKKAVSIKRINMQAAE